jgi:Carboxypeptidase regulatory-like domain
VSWGHRMTKGKWALYAVTFLIFSVFLAIPSYAQQTLGSIDGEVTDSSGGVVTDVAVKARNEATNLEVTAQTKGDGSFHIADLPIGTYEVTFSKRGFKQSTYPQILVRGDRTATINVQLQPGEVSTQVIVNATPLLNDTDTTTGYVLGELQVQNLPLGTGSFTQLAILSPGVNADLLNTSGSNAGFGNQAIWANGQRDTSNSFTLNGMNANNIFNGKSTSQVPSSRVAVNIGENGNSSSNPGGEIQTSTSVYGAIGQALPTPPPETIQEISVNSAMYDASQGATSGAHIALQTKSGTNDYHGGIYEYYQSSAFDANQWFFNNIQQPRPHLNRNVFGGYVGGAIKKDKLFFFASYQGERVADQLLGTSFVAVPPDLGNARDAGSIAAVANKDFGTSLTASDITPQALAILQAKTSNGQYFIPSAAPNATELQMNNSADAVINGPSSLFAADQINGNIDYNFNTQDRFTAKYYFQHDPNATPFGNSTLLGFPQTLNAGNQTISLVNTTTLTPNLSWEQRFGFMRQRAFATTSQFLTPADVNMNIFGLKSFPQINIKNADGPFGFGGNFNLGNELSIGPVNNFANAGAFQNNFEWASNLNWVHGRHTISTGINFDYTQLNIINKNNEVARVTFFDFPGFLQGQICGPNNPGVSCSGQDVSQVLNGASNRYYRAKQVGTYVQDDIKIRKNLTVDVGLRWDWDGPLYEKNGMLTNFYAQDYAYNAAGDCFSTSASCSGPPEIGLVVAGNNKTFGTKGVSDSTLTGRQWGFAPRIGIVYSPDFLKNFVVRAGFGIYYDRGEFFTELSPPAGGGISGPFGVTVEEPFVVPFYSPAGATFATPFGTTPPPPPPQNLSAVQSLVPNAAQLIANTTTFCNNTGQTGCGPLFFGGYDPKNTLPYSENWTLDLQWQPINTVVISLGYVGNHGVHELIPLPFNQAVIATPQHPALAGGPNEQIYSYGYNATDLEPISTLVDGFGTGNAALRAPFLGYDPNSDFNKSVGISNYNALQVSVNKRFSHGLLVTGSYTYSHTLDEQSGLGLFFSGNDPNNPHSSYANSDFDRTHVLTVSYHYEFPTIADATGFKKQLANGWGVNGITVYESGQPYSVIDFSGGAASIFWGGGQDAITNPIVPVGGVGATATNPILHGVTAGNGSNAPVLLNAAAFGIPPPFAPGTNGVPPCDASGCDYYETGYASGGRNIFRSPFQSRWDFGIFKQFQITERFGLRFDAQAFNIFNHPSFDVPSNDVEFNPFFSNPPIYTPGTTGLTPCVGPPANAYACPPSGKLGLEQHTIGSPRFLQFALHLTF